MRRTNERSHDAARDSHKGLNLSSYLGLELFSERTLALLALPKLGRYELAFLILDNVLLRL